MSSLTIEAIRRILVVINILFVAYLLGYASFQFLAVVTSVSKLQKDWLGERLRNRLPDDYYLPVSIIVPAYNESVPILGTVHSLMDLDYNIYEVIVVDDGSTDGMSELLIEACKMHRVRRPIHRQVECRAAISVYESHSLAVPLTLIIKENGGKADALNMGVNAARYPYVITMDADSMLERDAITKIVAPMLENGNVVAVGGLVRPANDLKIHMGHFVRPTMPKKALACMQVLEYDRSFLSTRMLFDQFNSNLIISGAFGLFLRSALVSVGGFSLNTIGEDMEIVVKLHVFFRSHDVPYIIKYAPNAVCWTQVPYRLRDLIRQRRRWHLGLFQNIHKYRQLLIRPGIGFSMWMAYLYYVIYELLSPIIEIIGIGTTILAAVAGLINVPFMLLFYLIYASYGWALSITAFFSRVHVSGIEITFGDAVKAIVYCLFENTVLRMILLYTRLTAFIGYRKNRLRWNKMQRQHVEVTYREEDRT